MLSSFMGNPSMWQNLLEKSGSVIKSVGRIAVRKACASVNDRTLKKCRRKLKKCKRKYLKKRINKNKKRINKKAHTKKKTLHRKKKRISAKEKNTLF